MANFLHVLFYVALFLAAIVKIFLKHKAAAAAATTSKPNNNIKLAPSPPKLPIIGNLHQIGKMPHLSLTQWSRKLGPIIQLQLGQIPTVVVSSAETAKEVMKTHDLSLCSRPQLYSAKWLFYDCTNIVFSPYGPYWRHVRKICILELLSAKRVQSFEQIRREEVSLLVHRIKTAAAAAAAAAKDEGFSLTRVVGRYANDVLCRAVLGRSFSGEGGEYDRHGFQSMLNEYQELLGGLSLGDFFPGKEELIYTVTGLKSRLKKTFHRFDKFFNEMIEEHLTDEHRGGKGEKDLLDVLLDVQRDGESGEVPLTMDNVKAILLDMFAAGTDTTFITLDWAMTELLMNPTILHRAQSEIRSLLGTRPITVTETDLPNLPYLKSIVKETFRLHPPVPILVPRESIDHVTVHGYDIPAKTRVLVNVWAIGRDPELWDEPERFDPGRFVGSGIDFKGQDFELLPFGAGRRGCPGIAFGTVIVELALAQMLHGFDWEFPTGVTSQDLDLSEAFGISMHKLCDLFVVAKPRFV